MSRGLDGTNPLAYRGVRPSTPPNMIIPGIRPTSQPRDPNQRDIQYNLGDHWLNTNTQGLWYLAALGSQLVGGVNTRFATWLLLSIGDDELETLSGDSGINPVFPDANKNINVFGDNVVGLTVVGDGVNTLTVTTVGNFPLARSITGDIGGAVPFDAAGNLDLNTANAAVGAGSSVLFFGTPGSNLLEFIVTDAGDNTLVGEGSGNLTLTTAQGNVALGYQNQQGLTTATANVSAGYQAAQNLSSGSRNVALGYIAMNAATTAEENVAIGAQALVNGVGLSRHIAIGYNALANQVNQPSGGAGSVAIGWNALAAANLGSSSNTAIGTSALASITTGNANIAIGNTSGDALTDGTTNVSIGNGTLGAMVSGIANVAIGHASMSTATDCDDNVMLGRETGSQLTSCFRNIAIGFASMAGATTASDDNIAIGYRAGDNYTTGESDNILLQHNGILGENNTIRVGVSGTGNRQQNRCFVAGIRGITTGVNDAIAVLIDSAGQLGTTSSSARYKENIQDMGQYSDEIHELRPVTFHYKDRSSEKLSVGLIAEEVNEVMPDLVVYDKEGLPETLKYQDLVPLMLNELQKQKKEIDKLQHHMCELEKVLLKS